MTRTAVIVIHDQSGGGVEVWYGNGVNKIGESLRGELETAIAVGQNISTFLERKRMRREDDLTIAAVANQCDDVFVVTYHDAASRRVLPTVEAWREDSVAD